MLDANLQKGCRRIGLVQEYFDHSRPLYCAKHGLVDEVVRFADLRKYLVAFAGSAYQNPKSICAHHQMILPRVIREQDSNS